MTQADPPGASVPHNFGIGSVLVPHAFVFGSQIDTTVSDHGCPPGWSWKSIGPDGLNLGYCWPGSPDAALHPNVGAGGNLTSPFTAGSPELWYTIVGVGLILIGAFALAQGDQVIVATLKNAPKAAAVA